MGGRKQICERVRANLILSCINLMRIVIQTKVQANTERVFCGFNEKLFQRLAPPFPPVSVLRFDGCRTGGIIHLNLNFILFRQDWISLITRHGKREREYYFVDEGKTLPFFLCSWRHIHRVKHWDGGTLIIDQIDFRSWNKLMEIMLYPILYMQFLYRKPVYRRIFNR